MSVHVFASCVTYHNLFSRFLIFHTLDVIAHLPLPAWNALAPNIRTLDQ